MCMAEHVSEEQRILNSLQGKFVFPSYLFYLNQSSVADTLFANEENILFALNKIPAKELKNILQSGMLSNEYAEQIIQEHWSNLPEDVQYHFYEHVNHFSLDFAMFLRDTFIADSFTHVHSLKRDRCYKCEELFRTGYAGLTFYGFPDRGRSSIEPFVEIIEDGPVTLFKNIAIAYLRREPFMFSETEYRPLPLMHSLKNASKISPQFHEWRYKMLKENDIEQPFTLYCLIKAALSSNDEARIILRDLNNNTVALKFFESNEVTFLRNAEWDRLLYLMPPDMRPIALKYLELMLMSKTVYFFELQGGIKGKDIESTYIFPSVYSSSLYNPYFFLKKYGEKITAVDKKEYVRTLLSALTEGNEDMDKLKYVPWEQLQSIFEVTYFN